MARGDADPIAGNATPVQRAQNSRIEIIVMQGAMGVL